MSDYNQELYSKLQKLYAEGQMELETLSENSLHALLNALLEQMDAENPSSMDMAFLDGLNAVLDKRNGDQSERQNDLVWGKIKEEIDRELLAASQPRRRKLRWAIAAIAGLTILCVATAFSSAGGYNLFDLLFHNTGETLVFSISSKNEWKIEPAPGFTNKEFTSISEFKTLYPGLPYPDTLPIELNCFYGQRVWSEDSSNFVYVWSDKAEEKYLYMHTQVFYNSKPDVKIHVQIDGAYSETYVCNKVPFQIESNYDVLTMTWAQENACYTLSSNACSSEEIKAMADYFYGGKFKE